MGLIAVSKHQKSIIGWRYYSVQQVWKKATYRNAKANWPSSTPGKGSAEAVVLEVEQQRGRRPKHACLLSQRQLLPRVRVKSRSHHQRPSASCNGPWRGAAGRASCPLAHSAHSSQNSQAVGERAAGEAGAEARRPIEQPKLLFS